MKIDTRRKSRELALQILFQSEFSTFESFQQLIEFFAGQIEPTEYTQFAEQLVKCVQEKQPEIDAIIEKHANNWKVSRIAKIDLILLRIAIGEMVYIKSDKVPAKASLNESLEIAKRFSTEHAPNFLNGILDKVLNNEL